MLKYVSDVASYSHVNIRDRVIYTVFSEGSIKLHSFNLKCYFYETHVTWTKMKETIYIF